MPKTKEQKKETIAQLKDKLSQSKSVVFTGDTGLNVKTAEALRKELRENKAEYLVAKKTLIKLADENLKNEKEIDQMIGSIGLTFSYDDEISGVKIVSKFAKENETFKISGGLLENKFILPEMVERLASLLSREQLLAKLVGTLQAPISGFARVLSGNTRNLVGVLSAIRDEKN